MRSFLLLGSFFTAGVAAQAVGEGNVYSCSSAPSAMVADCQAAISVLQMSPNGGSLNGASDDVVCQLVILQGTCVIELCNGSNNGRCYSNGLIASAANAVVNLCISGTQFTGGDIILDPTTDDTVLVADTSGDIPNAAASCTGPSDWSATWYQDSCSTLDVLIEFTAAISDVPCTSVPGNAGIESVVYQQSSGSAYNGFSENTCPAPPLLSTLGGCVGIEAAGAAFFNVAPAAVS